MHRSEQCAQLDFIDSNGIPIGIPIPGINKVASGVRRRITEPVPSSNATCEVSIEAERVDPAGGVGPVSVGIEATEELQRIGADVAP